MIQWHYPKLHDYIYNLSVFEFHEAPHPWGPWTLFHRRVWETYGAYNPTIPAKFVQRDGRTATMCQARGLALVPLLADGDFACGDLQRHWQPRNATVRTEPTGAQAAVLGRPFRHRRGCLRGHPLSQHLAAAAARGPQAGDGL